MRCCAPSRLAGLSFGLIEQPVLGWSDPLVVVPPIAGVLLFAAFLLWERHTPAPMLPLSLFKRRNFSVANIQTFAMYGGMAVQGFFLTLFLQQVAGFSALKAGSAGVVPSAVMFLLSRRFGRLADRYGPRWLMTVGPLLVASGFLLLLRLDATTSYWTDLFPALLVYSLGLAMTVAPLTATVLADADETDAGIASAVNNAIARIAGLLATAAVGAALAGFYADRLDSELAGRTLAPARRCRSPRRASGRSVPSIPPRCRRRTGRSSPRPWRRRASPRSISPRSSARSWSPRRA